MRKKWLGGAAALLLAALVAAGTWAYFTADTHVTNVITTGRIDITLHEETTNGQPFPENGITGVMPGTSKDKKVTVTNDGTSPAWVRARVAIRVVAADGTTPLDADQVSVDYKDGWLFAKRDGENEGYYYYKLPLDVGNTTTPLFEKVQFEATMPNSYQGCTVKVDVYVQAVQVAHNNSYIPSEGEEAVTLTKLETAEQALAIRGWSDSKAPERPAPAPDPAPGEGETEETPTEPGEGGGEGGSEVVPEPAE